MRARPPPRRRWYSRLGDHVGGDLYPAGHRASDGRPRDRPPPTPLRNVVRVPKSHTARTAPRVHTHHIKAASPLPIHRLATVNGQPQLDLVARRRVNAAPCWRIPRQSRRRAWSTKCPRRSRRSGQRTANLGPATRCQPKRRVARPGTEISTMLCWAAKSSQPRLSTAPAGANCRRRRREMVSRDAGREGTLTGR